MPNNKWIKVDKVIEHPPCWLDLDNDNVWYMHEKLKGGYEQGCVNQKVINFKHTKDKFGTAAWNYKIRACQEFAQDLSLLSADYIVTSIPTSKALDDPLYDPRFHLMFECLRKLKPSLAIKENLILRTQSIEALHAENSSSHRNPDAVLKTIRLCDDAPLDIEGIVLVDDVLTSGANFKGCEKLLRKRYPNIQVFGVFWAMMKHE